MNSPRSRRSSLYALLVPIAAGLAFAAGCGTARLVRRPIRPGLVRHAPVPTAREVIRERGLGPAFVAAPRRAAEELQGQTLALPDARGILALGEAAYRVGRREALSSAEAIPWLRDAAIHATRAAADPALEPEAIDLHNRAVAACLRRAGGPHADGNLARERLAAAGIVLESGDGEFEPATFDRIAVAEDSAVLGLTRHVVCGLGVPLVAPRLMPERSQRAGVERSYGRQLVPPLTAVMEGSPDGLAHLRVFDPMDRSTVPMNGRAVPLAADFTAPLAYQAETMQAGLLGLAGVLNAEQLSSETGVYMMHPYRPGKIPILFIHGLASSPGSWVPMFNEIRGDPALRARYQFWFGYYPTGLPTPVSAATLRKELHELQAAVDPMGSDPALRNMVLVGHSMGGLVSRLLVQSSGDRVWNSYFSRPRGSIVMSDRARTWAESVFYFEPEPTVRRVVFIATPHRGSSMANRLIGRVSSALAGKSPRIREMREELVLANGPDVFQPAYRDRMLDSIDNLQWDSPMLKTLAALPMAPGVPYHSIVGDITRRRDVMRWSDGVVPYESAHIDGAQSEIMVPYFHTSCNTMPEPIEEVKRILKLHLGMPQGIDVGAATGP